MNHLFVEWFPFAPEQVDPRELYEINVYLRILNLDPADFNDGLFLQQGHNIEMRNAILENVKRLKRRG